MGQLYQGLPREEIPWVPIINPERMERRDLTVFLQQLRRQRAGMM